MQAGRQAEQTGSPGYSTAAMNAGRQAFIYSRKGQAINPVRHRVMQAFICAVLRMLTC